MEVKKQQEIDHMYETFSKVEELITEVHRSPLMDPLGIRQYL
ncbi:hypothetical protein [Alteribacillus sp. YIM 98480]|nr:hypothetical protein [Alteribacillus sp. YIM 98480]